jgi:hypothetical protein
MEHVDERADAQIKRITQKGRKAEKKRKKKKKEKTKKKRKKNRNKDNSFDLRDDVVSPSANCVVHTDEERTLSIVCQMAHAAAASATAETKGEKKGEKK